MLKVHTKAYLQRIVEHRNSDHYQFVCDKSVTNYDAFPDFSFFFFFSRFWVLGSSLSRAKFFLFRDRERRKGAPFFCGEKRILSTSQKNVFVESDQARVGAPAMVGVGQTRAGGSAASQQRRRRGGGFERRADATKPKPEKARDSLPEPPIATGPTDRGSADARARSRDVHNDAERDEDRD